MAKKITVLIAVLFLFSCAQFVRAPVKYDLENLDKMFNAAIDKGTQLSYSIDEQDREHGLIKMSRRVGNSIYKLKIKFGPDKFTIEGEVDSDIINPFIGKDAETIEAAIKGAR